MRYLKIGADIRDKLIEQFKAALENIEVSDSDSFTFKAKMEIAASEKAVVYCTAEAYTKIVTLLNHFDKEVAWNMECFRINEQTNEYLVKDVMVYPQTVTGTTVDMDEENYAKWLIEHINDERFNNINGQGHSHVNMGVTPSGTDYNHQKGILEMLKSDGFYIFMIANKSFKSWFRIYDKKKNVVFEDNDVKFMLENSVEDLDAFLENAKKAVVEKKYTTVYSSTTYGSGWKGSGTTTSSSSSNSAKKSKKSGKEKSKDDDDDIPYFGGMTEAEYDEWLERWQR